jgi:hypothetical protein
MKMEITGENLQVVVAPPLALVESHYLSCAHQLTNLWLSLNFSFHVGIVWVHTVTLLLVLTTNVLGGSHPDSSLCVSNQTRKKTPSLFTVLTKPHVPVFFILSLCLISFNYFSFIYQHKQLQLLAPFCWKI